MRAKMAAAAHEGDVHVVRADVEQQDGAVLAVRALVGRVEREGIRHRVPDVEPALRERLDPLVDERVLGDPDEREVLGKKASGSRSVQ